MEGLVLEARLPAAPLAPVPGSYWRDLLAQRVELSGSRSSVDDLLAAVSGCNAGLVNVVGWLCDEIRSGRVQISGGEELFARPLRYEMIPGAPSYRDRLRR